MGLCHVILLTYPFSRSLSHAQRTHGHGLKYQSKYNFSAHYRGLLPTDCYSFNV